LVGNAIFTLVLACAVNVAAQSIPSLSPNPAPPGSTLTGIEILETNVPVTFNGVAITPIASTSSSVTIQVPANAPVVQNQTVNLPIVVTSGSVTAQASFA
jgi:hypothetical protein